MNIYCFTSILSFIHNVMAHVEITGELTFDINRIADERNARVKDSVAIGSKIIDDDVRTTVAIVNILRTERTTPDKDKDGCLYQWPSKQQVEALLSGMENHLTKIFIRATDYIAGRERRSGKRFKVVNKRLESRFFEQAYNLMSQEYRQSVNKTTETQLLSHDPCHHQADVKQIWQNLLDHSKTVLKKAAVRCVSDFLRVRNRVDDTRTKERLGELLLREIREVRSNQLNILCEDFELCFKDLL